MTSTKNSAVNSNDLEEKEPVKIILAEDDKDDQDFFLEALDAANIPSEVTRVENGEELLNTLRNSDEPNPDIDFNNF